MCGVVLDHKILALEERNAAVEARRTKCDDVERLIERLVQHLEQHGHLGAAVVGFVENPMHIFHRAHDAEVEHREREHLPVFNLAPRRQDDGKPDDRDMKQAFVDRLEPIEARHGETVFRFAGLPRTGGGIDARDFQRIGVRGPDVFETAELFHHRPVETFLRLQQIGPHALLRIDLPDRDQDRQRHDAKHDETDAPISAQSRVKRVERGRERRDEIGEADLEEFHEPFHAPRDPAVQRADALRRECAEIDLQEVADEPHRHFAFDARRGAIDEPAPEQLKRFLQHIIATQKSQCSRHEIGQRRGLVAQLQDVIKKIAEQDGDPDLDVGNGEGDDDAGSEADFVRPAQELPEFLALLPDDADIAEERFTSWRRLFLRHGLTSQRKIVKYTA